LRGGDEELTVVEGVPVSTDDLELVRRVESGAAADAAAIADALRRLRPDLSSQARPWAGGQLVALGAGHYVNRAVGAGLGQPVTAADLDEAEAFFARRGLPLELELCPHAHPSLLLLLGERGLRILWFRHVMVRPVGTADAAPADADPGDVDPTSLGTTMQVVTDGDLPRWQQILRAGNGLTGAAGEISDVFAAAAHAAPGATDLLACVDGEVVGAASLTVRDGRAELGGAVTLPRWRGRGVQAELLRARLGLAARAGCDLAVATADPGTTSARNLHRHGFRTAYTQAGVVVASS
jgi:GNAT superfamily N-acetyltransferase